MCPHEWGELPMDEGYKSLNIDVVGVKEGQGFNTFFHFQSPFKYILQYGRVDSSMKLYVLSKALVLLEVIMTSSKINSFKKH